MRSSLQLGKTFKNRFNHKTRERTLANLYDVKLHIEMENWGADKRSKVIIERANVVEHGESSRKQMAHKDRFFKKQNVKFKVTISKMNAAPKGMKSIWLRPMMMKKTIWWSWFPS